MERRWRKGFLLVALLLALSVVVAACQPADQPEPEAPEAGEPAEEPAEEPTEEAPAEEPPAEEPAEETAEEPAEETAEAPAAEGQVEQMRIGIIGDESTLNPYTYVTGYPGWNLLTLVFDTLYLVDANGVPQPWLATGSEISEDGLNVTIDLREDVTWHDGEPFTAEDVKFAYEFYLNNPSAGRFARDLRPVESIEVEGDYRVILTLTAPSPSLELGTLADVPIIAQHAWEGVDPESYEFTIEDNVGTGPYRLVEYQPDQFYRLEANADYFAGAPVAAELVLVQFADDAGALAALRGGEVDMLSRPVPPEQIGLLDGVGGLKIAQGPLFTTQMINYNFDRPAFANPAIRQAMDLAIDRQDLIDTVYLGAGTPGNPGWIHPESAFYNDAISAEYDVQAANDLLDEAGITDSDGDGVRELDGEPLAFEFITPGSDSLRLRLAELVREMLLEIGIDASVTSVEQATWEEAVWPGFDVAQGRNYDMAMWGWSAPVQADPIRIGTLVHSDPVLGSLNLTGYASEEVDALSAELAETVDPARQQEIIDRLQELMAEDLPFILLLYPDGAYAYNGDVFDDWVFVTGQGVLSKLSFLPADARP